MQVFFNQEISIEGRKIGEGHPVYIIAEAGVAHFGSLDKAKRMIEAAKASGVDAVKFQIFDIHALMSSDPGMVDPDKGPGANMSWKDRLGSRCLPYDNFLALRDHAAKVGITCFSTAHDEPSFDYLVKEVKQTVFKIGSGEIGNWPYLRKIAATGKPVILSVGMQTPELIAQTVALFKKAGNKNLAVLHCVTSYPAPHEDIALGNMTRIQQTHGVVTGYSDHTFGFDASVCSVLMGAKIVERHFCMPEDFGRPDAQDWKCSCAAGKNLGDWVKALREAEKHVGEIGPEMTLLLSTRDAPTEKERAASNWAGKKAVPRKDLPAGTVLSMEDIDFKRCGAGGIPVREFETYVGRKTAVDLPADKMFGTESIEDKA